MGTRKKGYKKSGTRHDEMLKRIVEATAVLQLIDIILSIIDHLRN